LFLQRDIQRNKHKILKGASKITNFLSECGKN
jgi:hypothetical protein